MIDELITNLDRLESFIDSIPHKGGDNTHFIETYHQWIHSAKNRALSLKEIDTTHLSAEEKEYLREEIEIILSEIRGIKNHIFNTIKELIPIGKRDIDLKELKELLSLMTEVKDETAESYIDRVSYHHPDLMSSIEYTLRTANLQDLEKDHKQFIHKLWDGTKVFLVDGSWIRNNMNEEFIGGGHGYQDNYISKDEIWSELVRDPVDNKEILIHEIIEYIFMKYFHKDYDDSHEIANSVEDTIRRLPDKPGASMPLTLYEERKEEGGNDDEPGNSMNTGIETIQKESSFNKVSFIVHMKGHKNSSGESAPYVIKSHTTNKILSSHKTRGEAEKHLQQMHIHKNGETIMEFKNVKSIDEMIKTSSSEGRLQRAIQDENLKLIKYYIEEGADVDTRGSVFAGEETSISMTSLMLACRKKDKNLVNFLIQKGANVNAADGAGYSVLYHASSGNTGSGDIDTMELIKTLIQNGALVSDRDVYFAPVNLRQFFKQEYEKQTGTVGQVYEKGSLEQKESSLKNFKNVKSIDELIKKVAVQDTYIERGKKYIVTQDLYWIDNDARGFVGTPITKEELAYFEPRSYLGEGTMLEATEDGNLRTFYTTTAGPGMPFTSLNDGKNYFIIDPDTIEAYQDEDEELAAETNSPEEFV